MRPYGFCGAVAEQQGSGVVHGLGGLLVVGGPGSRWPAVEKVLPSPTSIRFRTPFPTPPMVGIQVRTFDARTIQQGQRRNGYYDHGPSTRSGDG
ncbi:hypothetical protein [Streptomyces erythrochromogenes]|uniref:hypothetical protein n=1 Tax=Streptomyces erythrochromogenes TaxID=285574 RepID=UPI00381B3A37